MKDKQVEKFERRSQGQGELCGLHEALCFYQSAQVAEGTPDV